MEITANLWIFYELGQMESISSFVLLSTPHYSGGCLYDRQNIFSYCKGGDDINDGQMYKVRVVSEVCVMTQSPTFKKALSLI